MSPRAASRLDTLGFEQVHDYVAGKADWAAYGLPLEGEHDTSTRVGMHARADVPTCRLGDRLVTVRASVRASGWDICFVTDGRGVVLGTLGRTALTGSGDLTAEQAMSPGPSTVRPSYELEKAVERMRRQSLGGLPVTRPDGVLVGLIRRDDAERAMTDTAR